MVKEAGKKLIQSWLKKLNGDMHLFLRSMDVETSGDVPQEVMTAFFDAYLDEPQQLVLYLTDHFDAGYTF